MSLESRVKTLERRCVLLSGALVVVVVFMGLTVFLAADNASGPVELPAAKVSGLVPFTKDAPAECIYARKIVVVDDEGHEQIYLTNGQSKSRFIGLSVKGRDGFTRCVLGEPANRDANEPMTAMLGLYGDEEGYTGKKHVLLICPSASDPLHIPSLTLSEDFGETFVRMGPGKDIENIRE